MSDKKQSTDWSDLVQMVSTRVCELPGSVLKVLEELLDAGRSLISCAEAGLLVADDDGANLRFLVSVNSRPGIAEIVEGIRVPCEQSIAGCVFTTGQMIAVANPDDFYQQVDSKTGLETRIYMATPVTDDDKTLGVVTFVNRPDGQEQEPFTQLEIEWAMRLSDLIAVALRYHERMHLQQQLFSEELARTVEALDVDGTAVSDVCGQSSDFKEQTPLVRAMLSLERMGWREQQLVADLINVLNSHSADESAYE